MCLKDILFDVFKELQKLGVSEIPLGALELEFIVNRVVSERGYMLYDDLIQLLWRSHLILCSVPASGGKADSFGYPPEAGGL